MAASKSMDLLILTDATASMCSFLRSLNESLPEIVRLSALTGYFTRIGVAAYRDYCEWNLTEWSGWYHVNGSPKENDSTTKEDLLKFVSSLQARGGGDWPEAVKTGLALCYEKMNAASQTLVIIYTDAPAHTIFTRGPNWEAEQAALASSREEAFTDWMSASEAMRKKGAQVFSIVKADLSSTIAQYAFLSARTNGACFNLTSSRSNRVTALTIDIILAKMGIQKIGTEKNNETPSYVNLVEFMENEELDSLLSEEDPTFGYYCASDKIDNLPANLRKRNVSAEERFDYIANLPGQTRAVNFVDRYKSDESYRALVTQQLREIIVSDVHVLTVNPVFGSLWRAVCNDRENQDRDGLVSLFGQSIEKIRDVEEKTQMTAWLEESYNHISEILEIIREVPESSRFPCVFLDPTNPFNQDRGDQKPLTRANLLEIGRSCDNDSLQRMGRILTQLSYVAREADLPAHIRATTDEQVPRLPLALATSEHHYKFWKVLLHLILPGTILAVRPAALLAALSLRMSILPLREVADSELLRYKNWNDLDCRENWSTGCLTLLLDADRDYRQRKGDSQESDGILSPSNRVVFQNLVDSRILDGNMHKALQAQVGWQPNKTKTSIGPLVICKRCLFPRSVTIMASEGKCGHCIESTYRGFSKERVLDSLQANVSMSDNENTQIAWVECRLSDCRAQYVVYNVDRLRVAPKCYYCRRDQRVQGDNASKAVSAPVVECETCLSRIIWPEEYRPADFSQGDYQCPACLHGHKTVVEVETTGKTLASELRSSCLLQHPSTKTQLVTTGQVLFHMVSQVGIAAFGRQMAIYSVTDIPTTFTLNGKRVRNTAEIIVRLESLIQSRQTHGVTCSLCFSDFKPDRLRLACGRSGCHQKVCGECHRNWYGQNERGHIINVAALSCPFCRRLPVMSSISAYRLNTLGNLRAAVDEAGEWIYGWCSRCGFARQYIERTCQMGTPAAVEHWTCQGCTDVFSPRNKNVSVMIQFKSCPGCNVSTEKDHGCDHITCSQCDTDWCWACGRDFTGKDIYGHMNEEHGTIYSDHPIEYLDEEEE